MPFIAEFRFALPESTACRSGQGPRCSRLNRVPASSRSTISRSGVSSFSILLLTCVMT